MGVGEQTDETHVGDGPEGGGQREKSQESHSGEGTVWRGRTGSELTPPEGRR